MGQVIIEQIISVDGYAEDADGSINFFVNASWINNSDLDQSKMLAGVDAIVFGAKTYQMFAEYWPTADPAAEAVASVINHLPKFVVSSTLESAPWGADDAIEILKQDGVDAIRKLRERFSGNLIVWGSLTLSDALLRSGEVDFLRLRVLPVLIGNGRSFTPFGMNLQQLSLNSVRSFEGGLVVFEYRLTK